MVFDTQRLWAAKMGVLRELFPRSGVICCVRHLPWILDSLERLAQTNPLEVSKIYNYDTGLNIYARYEMISSGTGLVGYAWHSLRDAFFGPERGRLMLLTYETLAADPERAIRALGAPGLHFVRAQVGFAEREAILPPDLFQLLARIRSGRAQRFGVPIV